MGLAGPRKRRRIGDDPNNTRWSRSTSSYGQKIMSAQGWTPGSYLGAKDASHSAHFSAANAAPIRIALKDDNLGIGARRAAVENDNFGLRSLHDLYGRLNGKSDSTRMMEQSRMADIELRRYADGKWGGLNFVKGGLLVGDRIEEDQKGHENQALPVMSKKARCGQSAETNEGEDEQPGDIDPQAGAGPTNKARNLPEGNDFSGRNLEKAASKTSSKKKAKHSSELDSAGSPSPQNEPGSKEQTRRERKEQRRQRREGKRNSPSRQQEQYLADQQPDSASARLLKETPSSMSESEEQRSVSREDSVRTAVIPTISSRHAVRQRFIKHKRMASMDPQALREILMAKS